MSSQYLLLSYNVSRLSFFCSVLIVLIVCFFYVFFFNDTAPTKIYTYCHTLSLPDALPIYQREADIIGQRTEILDFLGIPRLLRAELVARESEDFEPAILIVAIQLLQPLILRGKAAFRCGIDDQQHLAAIVGQRSEEHTSELQSLMRISYAVFCLNKK